MDSNNYLGGDLSTTPAGVPPPGQVSNLINPHSHGYKITVCNVICLVLVLIFFALRMLTRIHIVKSIGWDDYCNILALVCWLVTTALLQESIKWGVGKHLWDVSIADMYPNMQRCWVFAAVMYCVTMLAIKLSILLLFRRLFPIDNFHIRWWFVVFFTVGYSLAGIFTSLFQCRPVQSTWTYGIRPHYCIDIKSFYVGYATLNVVCDFLILALPIPIIWGLNLKLKQKLILTFIFFTGSFSCVISIIRLVLIIQLHESTSPDLSWDLCNVMLASQGELTASIICSCTACLRPLFERWSARFCAAKRSTDYNPTREPSGRTTKTTIIMDPGWQPPMPSYPGYNIERDQVELRPLPPCKAKTDVNIRHSDSDTESTLGILEEHRRTTSNDRIVVRTTYNVVCVSDK